MSKTTFHNLILSLEHAFIDCVSAYVVLNAINFSKPSSQDVLVLILIYNFVAFGTQFLFGYISDLFDLGQIYTIVSSFTALLALASIGTDPIISILLAGSINAVYHIGGGSIILKTSKSKALSAGIFIAPGAIGLLLGTVFSSSGILKPVLFIQATLFLLTNLYFYFTYDYVEKTIMLKRAWGFSKDTLLLFLFLFSIVVFRALVGFSIPFPWRHTLTNAATFMTIFVFTGKILGGFFADRNGLIRTGLVSLFLSLPLIVFGIYVPVSGMLGVLLFQMTTSVTLLLIYKVFPENPGLSFGFTTLAIFIGSLPLLTDNLHLIKNITALSIFGVIAIALMYMVKLIAERSVTEYNV